MPDQISSIAFTPEPVQEVNAPVQEIGSRAEPLPVREGLPTAQPQQNSQNQKQPQQINTQTNVVIPNKVVDKTQVKEALKPVGSNADTLTSLADKEEEEFIGHVVEEHKHE